MRANRALNTDAQQRRFALPGEATHRVNFQEGVSLAVDAKTSKSLLGGAIGASGGSLTLTAGPSAHFSVLVANAYIFCTSQATDEEPPTPELGQQLDPTYNSIWEVTDPIAFRNAIGAALLEILTLKNLSADAVSACFYCQSRILPCKCKCSIVRSNMSNCARTTSKASTMLQRYPDYKEALAQAIFRKEARDKAQAEHRFAFLVTYPRLGVLSVAEAPIRIPLSRLHGLVSSVTP